MNDTTFNILLVLVAVCIAGAAYAKGQADGWNTGFKASSDIWLGIEKKDEDDDILSEKEIS